MNIAVDNLGPLLPKSSAQINLTTSVDRRADVDAKHVRMAGLMQEVGCDGLLILDPDNFAWLTGGAAARGILDPAAWPCLYLSPEGRWALSSNVDSQRLFDEELDGLGFQLKEWPWHWGRSQLLADLCANRKVGCDQPFGQCVPVGDFLRKMRRALTFYEQACFRALGLLVGHALEATCRTMVPGDSEREVAGQVAHRLVHRGANAVLVSVLGDDRARNYREGGFTAHTVRKYCVMSVTARKYGLHATASRSVCFGPPDPTLRREHDAVCRVSATYTASSWPDALPRQILTAARRVYLLSGAEHEWLLSPQGYITGRALVELTLLSRTEELLQSGWPVTWRASVGAALSCDTFLISEDGPRTMTAAESWPLKRIRVQGAEFVRPDLLIR